MLNIPSLLLLPRAAMKTEIGEFLLEDEGADE